MPQQQQQLQEVCSRKGFFSRAGFVVSPEILDKATAASVGQGFCQHQKLLWERGRESHSSPLPMPIFHPKHSAFLTTGTSCPHPNCYRNVIIIKLEYPVILGEHSPIKKLHIKFCSSLTWHHLRRINWKWFTFVISCLIVEFLLLLPQNRSPSSLSRVSSLSSECPQLGVLLSCLKACFLTGQKIHDVNWKRNALRNFIMK